MINNELKDKLNVLFIRKKSYYDFYKKHNYPYKPALESFMILIGNKEIEIIIEEFNNQIILSFKKFRRENEDLILENKLFCNMHTGKLCDGWLEYYE